MTTHLMFYATRNDLLPLLQQVEQAVPIKYTEAGRFDDGRLRHYPSADALPNLGMASNSAAVACRRYLMSERYQPVLPRLAGPSTLIDQVENSETVSFNTGGLWGDDILLHGRFATLSSGPFPSRLMKELRGNLRKRFNKIKVFYVGKEAQEMLNSGKRLTLAESTPKNYDLTRT